MGRVSAPSFAIVPEGVIFAEVSAMAKALWQLLAWHADREGYCYPGIKNLSAAMDVSDQTIRRAKEELKKAGLITCAQRFDDAGRRISDDIQLQAGYTTARRAPTKNGSSAPTTGGRAEITKPVVTRNTYPGTHTHETPKVTLCDVCDVPAELTSTDGAWCIQHFDERVARGQ